VSAGDVFILFGGAVPAAGFGTPVFVKRVSNALWVQDIDDQEMVAAFLQVDERVSPQVTQLTAATEQWVGRPALYLYADITGHVQIGSRAELEALLRDDFTRSGSPRIKRSIAMFLNQPGWIEQADREIAERRKRRRQHRDFFAPALLVRPQFHEALRAAREGMDVLVRGARGSGKTTMLTWLAQALAEQDGARVIGPVRGGSPAQLNQLRSNFFPDRAPLPEVRHLSTNDAFTGLLEEICAVIDSSVNVGPIYVIVDDADFFADQAGSIVDLLSAARLKTNREFSLILGSAELAHQPSYWRNEVTSDRQSMHFELGLLSPAQAMELLEQMSAGDSAQKPYDPAEVRVHTGFHLPRALLSAVNATGKERGIPQSFERIMADYYDLALQRSVISHPHITRTEATRTIIRILSALSEGDKVVRPVVVLGTDEKDLAIARILRDSGIVTIDDDGHASFSHAWFRDWWKAKGQPRASHYPDDTQLGLFDRRNDGEP
jgi:energy-coupling factor transporter ATP-binding protein EcfA2